MNVNEAIDIIMEYGRKHIKGLLYFDIKKMREKEEETIKFAHELLEEDEKDE